MPVLADSLEQAKKFASYFDSAVAVTEEQLTNYLTAY
jgi:hypothetical protein